MHFQNIYFIITVITRKSCISLRAMAITSNNCNESRFKPRVGKSIIPNTYRYLHTYVYNIVETDKMLHYLFSLFVVYFVVGSWIGVFCAPDSLISLLLRLFWSEDGRGVGFIDFKLCLHALLLWEKVIHPFGSFIVVLLPHSPSSPSPLY